MAAKLMKIIQEQRQIIICNKDQEFNMIKGKIILSNSSQNTLYTKIYVKNKIWQHKTREEIYDKI